MKINRLSSKILAASVLFSAFFSCNPEKDEPVPSGQYENGFFIVNEGGLGSSNASVSFFNRNTGQVENNVFEAVNGVPLGDIAQSMVIEEGKGLIVVNSSNKVEVVNPSDMRSVTTVTGLQMPRYVTVSNGKAFISEHVAFDGKGDVQVLDLTSYTLGNSIQVGAVPEEVLSSDGKIFVANGGSWYLNNGDSTVMIIDAATETVTDTVFVGYSPKWLEKDATGNIWVLCAGKQIYDQNYQIDLNQSKPGSLVKLSPSGSVLANLSFNSISLFPSNLATNGTGTKLYYNYSGNTYQMDYTSNVLGSSALINKSFYNIGIDPLNNNILGAVAGDFTSDSYILRYQENGAFIDTLNVGIGPNGFAFY